MQKIGTEHELVFHHVCGYCKRHFSMTVPKDEYGWAIRTNRRVHVFCSYSCLRKYEKRLYAKDQEETAKSFEDAKNDEKLKRKVYL